MNTQRLIDKLTSWPVTLTVCLLIVLGTLTVKLWPRTVPFDQCSDVYKRYAKMDGVDATFIKDYKVNDSVFVDVTLLETKDTALWENLCKDFGIASFSQYDKEYRELMTLEHSFDQRLVFDTIVSDNDSVCIMSLIIYSHLNMSMCIFPNIDDNEYDAIINNKYKEIVY